MKKLILFLLITPSFAVTAPIKLYAFFTPSHKGMLNDWFLPSIKDDYEIILECHDQECESGDFMQDGWLQTMHHKVDIIIRGIQENWGSFFIHSDVDIQFFKPSKEIITQLMQNHDLVIQKNHPDGTVCAGFFACAGNEKMLQLWKKVKELMVKEKIHDQAALNKLIRRGNPLKVRWTYLPNDFFCAGTIAGKHWNPGTPLELPKNIVLHHANWTTGVPNKLVQLEYVKNKVEQKS